MRGGIFPRASGPQKRNVKPRPPDADSEANCLQSLVLTNKLGNLLEFRRAFEPESSAVTPTIQVLKPERPWNTLGICRHRVSSSVSPTGCGRHSQLVEPGTDEAGTSLAPVLSGR